MKEQLLERLEQLNEELSNGRRMLADLQRREINLRETLLRISGAIQVIEEELKKTADSKRVGENGNAD